MCVCVCLQIESMGTNVLVHDALEGYLHEVQVRAQDEPNADSHWSDWSPLILARPWEGNHFVDLSQYLNNSPNYCSL